MIPATIWVGPIEYDIVFVRGLMDVDGITKLNGYIDYINCEIRIEENMDPQRQFQTLMHELNHAILANAGVEHDEALVEALALGWMSILVDNGPLMENC